MNLFVTKKKKKKKKKKNIFEKKKKKKKKKKIIRWDRYKCLELNNKISDPNKFDILSEELGKCRSFKRLYSWKARQ